MKKIKGICYDTEKDKDVIEHLDKQQNFSHYIKTLVRKDMKNESIETIVERLIEKHLNGVTLEKKQLNKDKIKSILDL